MQVISEDMKEKQEFYLGSLVMDISYFFLHCDQRSDNLREGTFLLARSQIQRVHSHHGESIVNTVFTSL